MKNQIQEWCRDAWAKVEKLPGGVGGDIIKRWESHVRRGEVVVTFFGPYDSGKSSLLKRLLVDDNCPIPDWLTVSGRRETFEIKEAAVLGVIVRDTPGIAGGNELHERIASEAVLLSDIIVLVLPPQIITSDKEIILSIMSGRRFGCPAHLAYPSQGFVVVLSRMDEAGEMPRDDLEGYRALVKRKLKELDKILEEQGVPEDAVLICPLASDPFGLVGNRKPSGKAEYDGDRCWDGVEKVANCLRTQNKRKSELRIYSELRFLGAELRIIVDSLERMSVERRSATEAAANEASSYVLMQERLKALLGAARSDLNRRIEEEISSLARRGAADLNALHEAILARLETSLDSWVKAHDAEIEKLACEIDAEMKIRHDRPSWKNLSEILKGVTSESESAASGEKGHKETLDKTQKMLKALHKAFREAAPSIFGMSIEEARAELKKRISKRYPFDERYSDPTAWAVIIDVGLDVVLPLILEFKGNMDEKSREEKAAEIRAERRKEIRQSIEKLSKDLAERAWSLWHDEGKPASLYKALVQIQASAESTRDSLKAESKTVADSLSSVKESLAQLHNLSKSKKIKERHEL